MNIVTYWSAAMQRLSESILEITFSTIGGHILLGNKLINTRLLQYATRMKGAFYVARAETRYLRGNTPLLRFLCCVVLATAI
jgi:hypothetical protein